MPAYQEKNRKTWFCKFYYKNIDGVRHQKWKGGFATREEALAYEEKFKEHKLETCDILFEHAYLRYIDEISREVKPSTIAFKNNIFTHHIIPYFPSRTLGDIKPKDIRKWQLTLQDDNRQLSKTYLRTINTQFNTFFRHCVRTYELRSNPCDYVLKMGSSRTREMNFWTPKEYKKFRAVVDKPVAHICFEMLYWTGLRVGELLALNIGDIDFERSEIYVNKNYRVLDSREYIWEPKTEQSNRRVMMPGFLCRELMKYIDEIYPDLRETYLRRREWVKRKRARELENKAHPRTDSAIPKNIYDERYEDEIEPLLKARIFPVTGTYLTYHIKKYADIAGLHRIRVHDLRHSHVSMLINEGFEVLEISKRVGHIRPSTTLNVYSHLFPSKQDAIAKRLDKIGG